MTIAIDTTSTANPNAAGATATSNHGGSSVTLQAQLDRCTKQLGDWVNCSSGKTPQGKQIIAALQEKISAIKAQIQSQQIQGGQGSTSPARSSAYASGVSSIAVNPARITVTPPASLALAAIGNVGTLLNTVA